MHHEEGGKILFFFLSFPFGQDRLSLSRAVGSFNFSWDGLYLDFLQNKGSSSFRNTGSLNCTFLRAMHCH